MTYCKEFSALLDPYIDGELSPEETARVREHLHTCDGCRAYVQAALAIRDAFPEAEDTPVPDGFAAGVMAAIRADAAPRKRRRPRWAKTLLPLAACCAVFAECWKDQKLRVGQHEACQRRNKNARKRRGNCVGKRRKRM